MIPPSVPPSPSPAPLVLAPRPARSGAGALALLALLLLGLVLLPGTARADGPRWQWPVPPPHQILARFDAPSTPYGPGHRGIDLAVPGGAEILAVEGGTVRFSGPVAGRGVVSVVHADGLISTYEPVTGTVSAGTVVAAGDVLGTLEAGSAASHCAGRDCLHLGARRGELYVDPLLLLGGRGPSVLLPWAGGDSGASSGAAAVGVTGGAAPASTGAEAGSATSTGAGAGATVSPVVAAPLGAGAARVGVRAVSAA